LLRELDKTAKALGRRTMPGRKRDEIAAGIRSVLSHPYTIFFRVDDTEVEFIRVLHEIRDYPGLFRGEPSLG
jgi:plasmid stabilization system protein ParE